MDIFPKKMLNNYLLLDENDKINFLDMSAYEYLKNFYKFYIGYPENKINKDDTLIIIEKDYKSNKEIYESNLLKKLSINFKDYNLDNFIAVSSYKNPDSQSIFKKNEKKLKINTIYRGYEIEIDINQDVETINLKIDGKSYLIKDSYLKNQIIIISDGVIKFYITGNIKEKPIIKEIFDTEIIPGNTALNKDIIFNKDYNEVFKKEFSKGIEDLKKNDIEQKTFKIKDNYVFMKKEKVEINGKNNLKLYFYNHDICNEKIENTKSIIEILEKEDKKNKTKDYIYKYKNIIGKGTKIKHIKYLLNRASKTNATIMLLGESGTGKSLIAEEIHKDSKRKGSKFINLNCAAIPVNLIESELFGYEEGAFTGAKKGGKRGYFEIANGGTIFLDEIGEIPLEIQGRLLEVLQNKTFYRVGGNEKLKVDVRVIAATNKNLEELVKKNKFRKDLFYRLNVFPIEIPTLRQRTEDIEILCKFLLPKICNRLDIEPLLISKETIESLKEYSWPGNIRELENTLEQSSIMCEGKIIKPENILINKKEEKKLVKESSLKKQREELEKRIIIETLNKTNKNKTETAEILDIGRTTLFEKMKKYNIEM